MSVRVRSQSYGVYDIIDISYLGDLSAGSTNITATLSQSTISQLYQCSLERKTLRLIIDGGVCVGDLSISVIGASSTTAHTWSAVCGGYTVTISKTSINPTSPTWIINITT